MKKIFKLLTLALAGAMFMVACDDTPAPYPPGGGEGGGDDTTKVETQEITCAKAVELCAALEDGASSAETYAITGYITDVFATVSNGQQSFWMSDNNDGQKVVQAYWANLPEGVEKFATGTKVKITGRLLKYVKNGGTVVTEVKNADVEILEDGGDQPGTEVTAITCAKAVELCAALADGASSTETYAITGYITDVFATVSKGQQSFWMSDNNDGQKVVQAYWANLPEGVEAFTKGSKVKITGKLLKYVKDGNVTTEVKNATVEILEQGGGETPDQPQGTPAGAGTEADPYNVAGAIAYISTLSSDDKPEALVYTKGVISEVVKLGTSGSIQFKMSDKNVDNSLLVYFCNNLGNVAFSSLDDLKVGDEVVVCGKVVNYKGNTPEYNAGAYLVSLNGKTEGGSQGGGEEPGGGDTPDVNVDASVVMAAAYSDCTEGSVDATPISFDAVSVSFDKNGGNNAPKYYYNSTAEYCAVRMYAKNLMKVTSTKTIAKVVLTCAAPGGGKNYNGNDEMTTTAGTINKASDNVTITIDNVNSKEVTITNDFATTSGGTQLRIVSMGVSYAK